jgi:putative tryptophan/tyrosine transport system substrate-binding protein
VAALGTCAAANDAGDRISEQPITRPIRPPRSGIPPGPERNRVYRRSKGRDRIPLGGGPISTLPIVFSVGIDPVKLGLVAALNRPGGNVTGVSQFSTALEGKRLELLHELVPNATVIAMLVNPAFPGTDLITNDMGVAARALGLKLNVLNVSSEHEFDTAIASIVQLRAGALVVASDPFFISRRDQLVTLIADHAVPTIYQFREFATAGGLMSYGTNLADGYRQIGIYVGRIFKGEKPADLPVVQPTRFEFVINLKTAKALRLDIPAKLLALADEVIE